MEYKVHISISPKKLKKYTSLNIKRRLDIYRLNGLNRLSDTKKYVLKQIEKYGKEDIFKVVKTKDILVNYVVFIVTKNGLKTVKHGIFGYKI